MKCDNLNHLLRLARPFVEACDKKHLQLLLDANIEKYCEEPKYIELQAKLLLMSDQATAGWSLMAKYAITVEAPLAINNIEPWDRKSKVQSLLVWWPHAHLGAAVMRLVFIPKLLEITDILGVVCDERLHEVFSRTFSQVECFDHESLNQVANQFNKYRYQVDLISIPGIFFARQKFAPNLNLLPQKKSLIDLNNKIGGSKSIRCGFSWYTTNPNEKKRFRRSIPEKIAGKFIASLNDVDIFSLQHGIDPAAPIKPFEGLNVSFPVNAESDIEGLIALLSLMDIVVTIDNSVVHLAGSMGIPTILLLPSLPEYKWGATSDTTPFHESVIILRNTYENDWAEALLKAKLIIQKHQKFYYLRN